MSTLTRAEFDLWQKLYAAAFAAWTARLVETLPKCTPAEVSKRAADAATLAADCGLESWRRKREAVAGEKKGTT